MKQRFIATLVAMALGMTTYVSFGSGRLFGNIGQRDDITSLYIGKTLLRLVGSSVTGSLPGVDIEDIADSLDSIEIVTGDSVKAKNSLRHRQPRSSENYKDLKKPWSTMTEMTKPTSTCRATRQTQT